MYTTKVSTWNVEISSLFTRGKVVYSEGEKVKLLYNYRTWRRGEKVTDVCGWKIGRKQQFGVSK